MPDGPRVTYDNVVVPRRRAIITLDCDRPSSTARAGSFRTLSFLAVFAMPNVPKVLGSLTYRRRTRCRCTASQQVLLRSGCLAAPLCFREELLRHGQHGNDRLGKREPDPAFPSRIRWHELRDHLLELREVTSSTMACEGGTYTSCPIVYVDFVRIQQRFVAEEIVALRRISDSMPTLSNNESHPSRKQNMESGIW